MCVKLTVAEILTKVMQVTQRQIVKARKNDEEDEEAVTDQSSSTSGGAHEALAMLKEFHEDRLCIGPCETPRR